MQKKYLWLLLVGILFFGCMAEHNYHRHTGVAEGTTFHIIYQSEKNYNRQIDSLLNRFEDIFSTYRKHSIISRFNRSTKGIAVRDSLFWKMLQAAQTINRLSGGAFDITVAPLVNAWGFGFTDTMQVDSLLIDSLRQLVGMHHLKIKGDSLLKDFPAVQIDANAIAKGLSVDYVFDFLIRRGIKNVMVEIGGEVRAQGVNDKGKIWRIGIDKPLDHNNPLNPDLEAVMALQNKAVATSGNYRKFYIKNGVRYSHTINPKTGYPVQHSLLSASVLAPSCMEADAWATAFMVLGKEKGTALLKMNHLPVDVFFIYDEAGLFKEFATNGFKQSLKK